MTEIPSRSSDSKVAAASAKSEPRMNVHASVWVALIGVVGTITAATIANWDKLAKRPSHANDGPPPVVLDRPSPRVEIERLIGEWVVAWLRGDADAFVRLSAVPFFYDHDIALTKEDLRARYAETLKKKESVWRELKVTAIKVQSAADLKAQGRDLSNDRAFRSLNLTLDDYSVIVTLARNGKEDSVLVCVRRIGDDYEIVGLWD